jgi:hypothetical protein
MLTIIITVKNSSFESPVAVSKIDNTYITVRYKSCMSTIHYNRQSTVVRVVVRNLT